AMTGEGQRVETSLLQNGLVLQHNRFSSLPVIDHLVREPIRQSLADARENGTGMQAIMEARRREYEEGQIANIYYRVYYTSDGAIAVGNLSAELRQKFRDALGVEYDPRDHDPDYDPKSDEALEFGARLRDEVEAKFAAQPTAYWSDYLDRAGVPNG